MSLSAVLAAGNGAGNAWSINGNQFTSLGGKIFSTTTEANTQTKAQTSWTLKKLGIQISANTYVTAASFSSRIAGSTGSVTISVNGVGAGWASDSTHSDSVVATNLLGVIFVATTVATTCTIREMACELDGSAALYVCSDGNDVGVNQATNFYPVFAAPTANTLNATEADQQSYLLAGTLSELLCHVDSAPGATTTNKCRIGGVDGNQVNSIGSGTTGFFQDTTHSDSTLAGSLVATTFNNTVPNGHFTLMSYQFASTGAVDFGSSTLPAAVNNVNNGTTALFPLGGIWSSSATEAQTQIEMGVASTLSNLRVLLPTTLNCSVTTHSRIAGSPGNLTTFTANGTVTPGWIDDSTHSDSITPTTLVCGQLVTGAGTASSVFQFGISANLAAASLRNLPLLGVG